MSRLRTIEISDSRFEDHHLREVTFKSAALRSRADMTLFVPPNLPAARIPLVLLLHGVYASHWAWTRKGGAHLTAMRMIEAGEIPPLIIAMPSDGLWGDGSAYIRHPGGRDFEQLIVEEVPAVVSEIVPAAHTDAMFIAGMSMGGFAALKLGAKFSDRFAAISAHSAVTHFSQMTRFIEEPLERFGPVPDAEKSVVRWILTSRETLPALRFDCGTDDGQLAENRRLHQELQADQIPHTYEEFPGGHDWPYWQTHLADTLRFFASQMH